MNLTYLYKKLEKVLVRFLNWEDILNAIMGFSSS